MNEPKFYRCAHCGNLVGLIEDHGVPMLCCGEPMQRLEPNTAEASHDRHLPFVEIGGDTVTVQVGIEPHEMTEAHHIAWAYLLTVKGCLPADDADDPKYADFGRELIRSGKGVFTEHGLLFVDENTPFVRDYDGQNFPAYVYDQMLCFIRAEYNGKTEFLYLPCEEEAIDKAFARLGAPTPDDVELSWEDICIDSDKWIGRFKEIAAEEGVYELNRLATAVNNADIDLEKLWAVAEYGKAEDAKQLARLAENLDCFTFIVGASNYEEVGIYVTENNEDFSVNPSVEKFFDYKAFGKYIGDAYYGEFVDGGFIYNDTDTSLLDILYQDEPMTMGGM